MNETTFGRPHCPISLQLPSVTHCSTTHTCAAPSTGFEVPITHSESAVVNESSGPSLSAGATE